MNRIILIGMNIIIVLGSVANTEAQKGCPINSYCKYSGECQSFISFQDLNFSSCLSDGSVELEYFFFHLQLQRFDFTGFQMLCTKNRLVLNTSFEFTSMLEIYKQILDFRQQAFMLNFYNLAGFDVSVTTPPLYDNIKNLTYVHLTIAFSPRFNFYLNDNDLMSCKDLMQNQTLAHSLSLFASEIIFKFVKFDKGVCPEVFRNVHLNQLSFVGTDIWKLQPKSNSSEDLNVNIVSLEISMPKVVKFVLDKTVLSSELFGVVTNSLLIAVILHNKIKYKNKQTITLMNKSNSKQLVFLLDEPLYKYMLINAVISLVYCFMYLLELTIQCAPKPFYDGEINNYKKFNEANCLNKDIVIGFFGSSLKLLSNVMVLEMAINRYTLLGKDHAKLLLNLAGLNIKKVFLVSLVLSALLSSVTVFQELTLAPKRMFHGETDKLADNEYKTNDNPEYYIRNFFEFPYLNDIYFKGFSIVMAFSLIYHQLSDTLFCIFSLILDILTLKRLRQVLNEHAKIAKGDDEAKKKRAAEVKGFWMVFAFNLTNALIRVPDLVTSVFLIVGFTHPPIFYSFCVVFTSCLTLDQLTNVFYILSLSINFFLYNAFYSTFRDCFSDFVETLRKKFQKAPQNTSVK